MNDYTSPSTTPNPQYFGVFFDWFRRQVHHLIAWGYQDALPRIQSVEIDETSITGFIAEAIQDRFRARDCPRWCSRYAIKDDPPVKTKGRSGRQRLRTDIIIECSRTPGRPEYVFEGKRLKKKGFGASKYVGTEGMGCFIDGRYASRYNEAAMLGYVQSDSVNHWQIRVRQSIERNAKSLLLKPPQRDVRVIDAFPLEWASEHERKGIARPITIYHILLDCRPCG